jgi:DNA-binding CsgD family transcriptional regulator
MTKPNQNELANMQKQNLFLLNKQIDLDTLQSIADFLPGLFHVNRGKDLLIKWISQNVRHYFPVTPEQIAEEGFDCYLKFIHQDTIKYVFPRFADFYKIAGDKRITTEMQNFNVRGQWTDFYTSSMNSKEYEVMVTMVIPVNDLPHNMRLAREIQDDPFVRKNFVKYEQLTDREKEIIAFVARGHTSEQIAERLFIAKNTVNTHRRNINKKLDIKHTSDLIRYAQAFGLMDDLNVD